MNKIKYGWMDFKNHFMNQRFFIFCLFQFSMLHLHLDSVIKFTKIVDYPTSPWVLPFVCANIYFLLVYGISVVYFYSDTPFLQKSQMYVLMRQGKTGWVMTKILRIWLSAFCLTVVEFLLSIIVLLPRIEWIGEWGKVYNSIAMTSAADDYNIALAFPYEIINMGNPMKVTGICLLTMFTVTGLMGMVMFTTSLVFNRTTAVFISTAFTIFTVVMGNIYYIANWFSYIAPFSWINVLTLFGKEYEAAPSFEEVLKIGFSMTLILTMISCRIMKTRNLIWIEEE